MTYSADSPILGTGTVSAEAINAWLAARGKIAAQVFAPDKTYRPAPFGIGQDIIAISAEWGVNHDLVAAQISKESAYWQSAIVRDKNNPSGLGAENDAAYEKAITFPTAYEGIRATVAHLMVYAVGDGAWTQYDPRYQNVKDAGWLGTAPTLKGLDGKWAYPGKGYGADIAARANDLIDFANNQAWEKPVPKDVPKIVLAAGHRNASGGDAIEKDQTAQLTPLLAAALRRYGMDVRVITPDEGRGMYPGKLDAVASQVRSDDDLFLEVHTEGNNGGDAARGVFVVYPDWDDDVDVDARDTLGPMIAERVSAASGMPIRGNGLMSEKKTGVGLDGYRLGIFRVTAPLRSSTTRLIVEYGSHSSPADMARWNTPGVVQAMADATALAIADFYNVDGPIPISPTMPAPDANVLYFPETGHGIGGGFRYFWENRGGLEIFGFPITDEMEEDGRTVQYCERAVLEYHPENIERWRVLLRHLGRDAYRNRYGKDAA